MNPSVCVICVGIASKTIAKVLKNFNFPAEFAFRDLLLHPTTPLPKDLDMFDVLLSSGNNARILKNKTDKPIITISPSLYDILLACNKALEHDAKPIVMLQREAFLPNDFKQISDMLIVDVVFDTYENMHPDIEKKIAYHKSQGANCVIGNALVCNYAEKQGVRGIYLFPEESIRNSLYTAANLAVSIFQKKIQTLHLSSIVNSAHSGIILVDSQENIFLCNPWAKKYLDIRKPLQEGIKIGDIFDKSSCQTITGATDVAHFFTTVHETSYTVKVVPIITKNEVRDRLLYLEALSDIQKTEREFRRETWIQKGFSAKHTFEKYHSENSKFQNFLTQAKCFALTEDPVVILGETGVGKEVLAQSIHNHSSRAGKAFVAVNCAAIPENLLESELFGYSEGAFTGAKKGGKVGYFEMAHMGTIFLDEIGEINFMLQSKLLRAIQEKQILRVGGTKVTPFNARIIAATNKDLWQLVQDNTFRKDLYYRLNVLELEIPPLRERPEDTLMLFEYFLRKRLPALWNAIAPFSKTLRDSLASYSWPGNIRELENFVNMLAAFLQPNTKADEAMELIRERLEKKRLRVVAENAPLPVHDAAFAPSMVLKSTAEQKIHEALQTCGGNITRAATMLGIHRTTLWRKIKRSDSLPTRKGQELF